MDNMLLIAEVGKNNLRLTCKSPSVCKGDTLNVEHIALAHARACAPGSVVLSYR